MKDLGFRACGNPSAQITLGPVGDHILLTGSL